MKTKKSIKADLGNKRMLFLTIGYVTAIGLVFAILNYATPDKQELVSFKGIQVSDYEEVLIPITRIEEPKIIQKPAPVAMQLDIIDNDEVATEDIEIDMEATEDLAIVIPVTLEQEDEVDEPILDFADIMPSYPGGTNALFSYLSKNLKYPKEASLNSVQGKVYVFFVVNKFGKVTDVKIGRSADKSLEPEALRVVAAMPDWNPGVQDGKPANVKYALPINFKLN